MWNFYGCTIISGSMMYVALQFFYRAGAKGGSGVLQLLSRQCTVCSNKIKYNVQYIESWTYTLGKQSITVYNMVAAAVVCFRFSRLGSCLSWFAFQRPCEVVQVFMCSSLHLPASTAFWIIHFLPWIITLPGRSVSVAHSDPSAQSGCMIANKWIRSGVASGVWNCRDAILLSKRLVRGVLLLSAARSCPQF